MPTPVPPGFRPRFDCLEPRDVPAALFAEGFDQTAAPYLPAGWNAWGNMDGAGFMTSKLAAASGSTGLAATGTRYGVARFWNASEFPGDTGVSASVKSGNPTPVGVLARGQRLDTYGASYLAAVVGPTGQVEIVESINGASRPLATVAPKAGVFGPWLRVTLTPAGGTAAVKLQRLDTGEYLNAAGDWQAGETVAVSAAVTWKPAAGQLGATRTSGGTGMAFLDDLTAVAPSVKESFDGTAIGRLPGGWAGWRNDSAPGFAVTGASALSPGQGLGSDGGSRSASRAWVDAPLPADVQASAAVLASTRIPATVFVRGWGLDSAKPTYYGLTLVRGVEVQLVRVVDGVETVLGSVASKAYTSGQWVKLTLTADGTNLRAVVYRTDTGKWLSADGAWVDYPDQALSLTDSAVAAGGYVGVARGAGAAGAVVFDDLHVRSAAAATGPGVTVTASQPGTAFADDVTFRAVAGDEAKRVEFRLDGKLKSATATRSGEWTLDTTLLANGEHELVVRAIDGAGNIGTATVRFAVANANPLPPVTRPELPRHFDHIRIAQLAYDGTPMDPFTLDKLATAVDLVVSNPRYMGPIDAAAPDTPQIVYTNVSNLYQGLLTSWLNYADAHGVSRELAFYHVAAATPWANMSQSAQPVNWFWGVYRTGSGSPVDLTAEARGGRPTKVEFPAAGGTVAVGYTERFRELNVALAKPAGAGWAGAYEYASGVDAAGNVTAWKPLPVLADGTSGLRSDGRVTFDPPADWVAGKIDGCGERLFYVRVRATAGTAAAAPVAATLLGRDYAAANGGRAGTIPAFDAQADADGDGYLSDAEFARRRDGFDARFAYESRLFYPNYGQMRFATNPASSAVRRWAAEYHAALITQYPAADGFFVDNAHGRVPTGGAAVIEPVATFNEDYANLTLAVRRAVAPKLVFSNTVGGLADANPVTGASTGAIEEFLLRPLESTWSQVLDVAGLVKSRLASDTPAPYVVLDTHTTSAPTTDPRLQAAALAYYYLVADPDRTMVMFFGGLNPAADWKTTWIAAAEVDVGRPTGDMTVFAAGADPQNPGLGYQVFGREYENGLSLYKPLSYTLGRGTGTRDDATATTHQLNGSYRVVNADGTLGPVVTQVTLRNGEGAVLVKA